MLIEGRAQAQSVDPLTEQPGLSVEPVPTPEDPEESSVTHRTRWVTMGREEVALSSAQCVGIGQRVTKFHPPVHNCHINPRLLYPSKDLHLIVTPSLSPGWGRVILPTIQDLMFMNIPGMMGA